LEDLNIDEAHERLNLEEAVRIAFTSRVDLHTVEDRVEDAERRVGVAANALLPQFDLVASGRIDGAPNRQSPNLDFDNYAWNAGLEVDLPLDRKVSSTWLSAGRW
jgi:outer membrane protein TolC